MITPEKHILPDLPGKVHGIKSLDPCTLQCDGCGLTVTGEHLGLTVLSSGIVFNTRVLERGDRRRMCGRCWAVNGWDDTYHGWRQRDAA